MNLFIIKNNRNWFFGLLAIVLIVAGCKKDKPESVKEAMTVSEYYPNSGNQGTLVTVLGTGFGNRITEASATFAGVAAEIVSVTPTAIIMRAPNAAQDGEIVLKIGETVMPIGQYTYQELSVQQISPSNGGAGTLIRISGAGFSSLSGPAKAFINGVTANIISAKDTLIFIQVPANASSGPIKIVVNDQEASGQSFRFQSISNISPLTGGKGTKVRITGTGFEKLLAGNYVDFNGKAALVEQAAEEYLVVVAPDGVTTGAVSVTSLKQKIIGPLFTVVAPPAIVNVTPLSGPTGSVMTISGSTFSTILEENKVTINGVNVPLTSATANKITLNIPGGTGSGRIILSVNDQQVIGPEFKDQRLGISKLSPENGLAGSQVTITGTGFSTMANQNLVTFNGTIATVLSATENSLVVVAPEGFTSGPLKVVANGLTALAPADFNRAGVMTLAGGVGNTELTLASYKTGSIVVDSKGNIFVLETEHHRIKKIAADGTVSLFAGSSSGNRGDADGQGSAASFSFTFNPGLSIDDHDNLFVSDIKGLRKVTPAGLVSTFATGLSNILKSSFNESNLLFVQRGAFDGGWRIDRAGVKTAIQMARSGYAEEVKPAVVGDIVYSADYSRTLVQGYNFQTATPINIAGGFAEISTIITNGIGNLYVAEMHSSTIRKINLATKEVTILAKFNIGGHVDGSLSEAKFGWIGDMAIDKNGDLYVIDMTNNAIRKVFLK